MANPEHLRWILEGPESWNKRQVEHRFTADLSGIDLYEEFKQAGKLDDEGMIPLQRMDLRSANLERLRARHANLEGADLLGASLRGASLDNARMERAKLCGTNLEDSALDDANLDNAELTSAQLRNAWPIKASLRGAELDYANAEGAHFEEANLEGASLNRTNLEGASLKSARLPGARLRYTNLKDVCLDKADLTNAYLFGADLTQATLIDADLSGANLGMAILTKTDLQNATLTNTILERTELSNAYLAGTTPWKAILFEQSNITPHQWGERQEPIQSVEDLLSEIRRLEKLHSTAALYFRGEAKSQWSLRPSVMRSNIRIAESGMLIDLISRRPEEFNATRSALAQWVLGQHHGLRTRFLDITRNPLVALYSACEEGGEVDSRLHVFAVPKALIKPFNSDTITVIANFAKLSRPQQDVLLGNGTCSCHSPGHVFKSFEYRTALRQLYQLIRTESPSFEERINLRDLYKVFIVEPQQSPERIRAQSGAFLVSAFHEQFERDSIQQWNERVPVYAHYKLTLEGKHKLEMMKDLRLMNITQETLFPGLETSAKAIIDRHCQEEEEQRRKQIEWEVLEGDLPPPVTEIRNEKEDKTRSSG